MRTLRDAALGLVLCCILTLEAKAITFTPFGMFGEGGSTRGQTFTVGPGGDVFQIDAFLLIPGVDLNGAGELGEAAQLGTDALPAGLAFSFMPSLNASRTTARLRYTFTNNTPGSLANVRFLSFLDAEIDEATTTFFNEFAETTGALAVSATDPTAFEIDEPGFALVSPGDIFDNLLLGMLDNTHAVPMGSPDDVSMALAFDLGTLAVSQKVSIDILIAEDGSAVGSFAITQRDNDPGSSGTMITFSGQQVAATPIPEPSTLLLLSSVLAGLVGFQSYRRRTR